MRTITVSVPNILKPFQFKVGFAALLEPRLESVVSGNLESKEGTEAQPYFHLKYACCVKRLSSEYTHVDLCAFAPFTASADKALLAFSLQTRAILSHYFPPVGSRDRAGGRGRHWSQPMTVSFSTDVAPGAVSFRA